MIRVFLCIFCMILLQSGLKAADACPSLLQHEVSLLEKSTAQNLCEFQGKVLLIVNTASGCGFTPQLKGLEALQQKYRAQGFTVLGFPSNSFFQENLEGEKLADFCRLNYGVTFPVFEKIEVVGKQAHPLFQQLRQESKQAPQWNFFKYLIDQNGKVLDVFPSSTAPDSPALITALKKALSGQIAP